MANGLDELNGPVNEAGRGVNVIEKPLNVEIGMESTLFELGVWVVGIIIGAILLFFKDETFFGILVAIAPGGIYWYIKIQAQNELLKLEQDIQAKASSIDNYLEQRVTILKNVAGLVNTAVKLDEGVMTSVAAFRGGMSPTESNRNEFASNLESTFNNLIPHIEAYPELKAHAAIADAMRQNAYLQKEITAARELYNDTILKWNTAIFEWPAKKIVAAKAGYSTRIPFSVSADVKKEAKGTFF